MTELTRPVTRQTSERDHRTGKPLVIRLEEGGRLVRMKVKGSRTWYTIGVKEIWVAGARNKAARIKAERKAKREARRKERGG